MSNLYHSKPKGVIPVILLIVGIVAVAAVGTGIVMHAVQNKVWGWLNLVPANKNVVFNPNENQNQQLSNNPNNENQNQPPNPNQSQIDSLISQMKENSLKWFNTTNKKEKDNLHQANIKLANQLQKLMPQVKVHYDEKSGIWYKDNEPLYEINTNNTLTSNNQTQTNETQKYEEGEEKYFKPFKASNGKYGFKDQRIGKWVIEPKYDSAGDFSEGLADVYLNHKWGYIDKTGKMVIEPKYDEAGVFHDGLARVELNHKYGYIDKTGRIVIEPKYDDAKYFSEGLAAVYLNHKYGYIDKTGKWIIEPKYDNAGNFSEGFAFVELNYKYGYIDKTGKMVIEPKYDDAGNFTECGKYACAEVRLKGKYYCIINTNTKGIIIEKGTCY